MDIKTTDPDFGTLPEIVWVRILEYLDFSDRYSSSIACSNIYQAFHHPTLWRSVTLTVFKNQRLHTLTIPKRNFYLVSRFGKVFQSVTFSVQAPLDIDFGEWNAILNKHCKEINIGSVTFNVGGLINTTNLGRMKTLTNNLKPMLETVRNSSRLKSLIITSWPVSPKSLSNADENVFEAAIGNENIKDLNTLGLFHCDSVVWSERRPLLPPMDLVRKMVEHFKNLSYLSLRSPMITEELIMCLSCDGRQRLQELRVTINFVSDDESFRLPKISELVWREFTNYNHSVQVHILVLSKVPYLTLQQFLRVPCPLHGIRFGQFVRCDKEFVSYLADNFTSTLESFEYHEEGGDCEQELVNLVENTSPLRHLVYCGKISYKHVIQLAEARGTEWQVLSLSRKKIYTVCKNDQHPDPEQDQVIVKNTSGEYVLVNMLKFHEQSAITSNEEEELMMIEEVSQRLGREWFPEQHY